MSNMIYFHMQTSLKELFSASSSILSDEEKSSVATVETDLQTQDDLSEKQVEEVCYGQSVSVAWYQLSFRYSFYYKQKMMEMQKQHPKQRLKWWQKWQNLMKTSFHQLMTRSCECCAIQE